MFDKSQELFPIKGQFIFLSHCGIAPFYSEALRTEHEIADDRAEQGRWCIAVTIRS